MTTAKVNKCQSRLIFVRVYLSPPEVKSRKPIGVIVRTLNNIKFIKYTQEKKIVITYLFTDEVCNTCGRFSVSALSVWQIEAANNERITKHSMTDHWLHVKLTPPFRTGTPLVSNYAFVPLHASTLSHYNGSLLKC